MTKAAKGIDARHPHVARGFRLHLIDLIPLALHFKNEVERFIPRFEPDQKVGHVAPRGAPIEVGDVKTKRLVLGIGENAGMGFERQRKRLFLAAIQDDVTDVRPGRLGTGLPAWFRGDEVQSRLLYLYNER